jgi:hypothetical protein
VIHYSVIPCEVTYYEKEKEAKKQRQIELDGVSLLVEVDQEQRATIVQVLSPNPQVYLDERFQPGRQIYLFPKI